MENKENGSEEKKGFMQGGGFILFIILGTIAVLIGIKVVFGL